MNASMWNPTSLRDMPWRSHGHRWNRGHGHELSARGTRTDTRLFAAERTRTSDVQLQIRTDDGDTVTLTLHAQTDSLAASYRSRATGEDGRSKTAMELRSLTSTREMSISVEGSLDEEEMAAIDALAAQVGRAVQGFFEDGAPIAAALAGVGSEPVLEPLAGFRLDVSRTDTLDLLLLRMRNWTRGGDTPAPLPALEPVPSEPVAGNSPGAPLGGIADAKELPVGRRLPSLVV